MAAFSDFFFKNLLRKDSKCINNDNDNGNRNNNDKSKTSDENNGDDTNNK